MESLSHRIASHHKNMTTTAKRVVIAGAGNSAGYVACALVTLSTASLTKNNNNEQLRVTMIGEERHHPYERPALTKGFLHEEKPARLPGFHACVGGGGERQTKEWYEGHGVNVMLDAKIVECDFEKKVVETNKGDRIEYDDLIIATGVSAHKAEFIEGHDLERKVKTLRSHDDALELIEAMERKPKNPLIVGGGYIGMEIAAAMCHRGLHPTVVMMESHVMARLFTADIAKHYESLYESKGAKFIKNCSVKKINDAKDTVVLNDGKEIAADLVVLGVGSNVKPNVESFGALEKADDGGIKVNGQFETSIKGVYAIGDVCSFPVRLNGPNDVKKHSRMEHVKHARASAAHCGRIIAEGSSTDIPEYIYEPFFYSRVFEQPGSDRPVSWQFYGFGGASAMQTGVLESVGPIGDFHRQLANFWIEKSSKRCVGVFLESSSSAENDVAKRCAESSPIVDVDALKSASTVERTMSILANALKQD